jgi:hypothetical protein
MKDVVIQSIWLVIALVVSFTFLGPFAYLGALIFGLIPLWYLKKRPRNDILKTNLWSSLVTLIVAAIAYASFVFYIRDRVWIDPGKSLMNFLGIINFGSYLPEGLYFVILFNVPFLIYFFFRKKDAPVTQSS